jgi:hypothetical protein
MDTSLIAELKDEIRQIKESYPRVKDDAAFVLWFVRAQLVNSEDSANDTLTGESGDKGIDAIYIDHQNKEAHIIQGKYRAAPGQIKETRNDVMDLAEKASLPWASKAVLDQFYSKLAPRTKKLFQELIKHSSEHYALKLYYVTTGSCSTTIKEEARAKVAQSNEDIELLIYDWPMVSKFLKDYLEGVAPAIPTLMLKVSCDGRVQTHGNIYRFDPQTRIESWVFSMAASDAGDLYEKAGIRLFARNIRGYLGDTEINKAIISTLTEEPNNFWYYNNGITILCDDARQEKQRGQDILRVERPQVINGQQTVRSLNQARTQAASVLVKLIKVPREERSEDEYDDLVRKIVEATNWQNAIKPSDLISNDRVQVFLERELRKAKYLYIRKRQTKQEARTAYGGMVMAVISKDELAQAKAACIFDPVVVRKGKEGLFEETYYAPSSRRVT